MQGRLHFSVSPYGFEQLKTATHDHQLVRESHLHLCIDGFHMGIGGMIHDAKYKARYLLMHQNTLGRFFKIVSRHLRTNGDVQIGA